MKRTIVIIAVIAAVLGAVAIRVVVEGRRAIVAGDDWLEAGRPADAIRSYETAARWYLPLAPHVDAAYAKLRALANPGSAGVRSEAHAERRSIANPGSAGVRSEAHAERRSIANPGSAGVQLAAWRAIRSAARATRSLWTPHADDLAAADAAIARISAGVPQAGTAEVAWHAERLARDPRPSLGSAILAAFGILLWVGGAIALARRGIDPAGRLVRRVAAGAGITIVVGLACWAAGLYNA